VDYFLDERRLENAPPLLTAPSEPRQARPTLQSHDLVRCPANSPHKFVIPTGAKRSGEPALSDVEGDLAFKPFASSQDPAEIYKEFMGHDLDAKVCVHEMTEFSLIIAKLRL